MMKKNSMENVLTGDMFVNAFNNASYPPNSFSQQFSEQPQFIASETVVSSPEQAGSSKDIPQPGVTDSSGPRTNPRSCVMCRRRKVRCDKIEPACGNCTKASIDCVFPPPGRAPRKPRQPHDAELLKRLRRLESVVDKLGADIDEDGQPHVPEIYREDSDGKRDSLELSPQASNRRTPLEHGLGRLLIKEGRSRYVSNEFWSTLGEEIAEIRNVLDSPSSEDEDDAASPEIATDPPNRLSQHQGFIFGYSSLMFDTSRLHPSPSHIFIIWEIFKENVDPTLKILHVPTVKNIIMKAAVSASHLSKASEALFYSICFASVISMTEDECRQLLNDEKDKLMQKYRFACEQGLARAQFLNSSNLMVLQAFVMYLTVVKFVDTSRAIWALSGLSMQQAQAQGLHRDGANFPGLRPFDIEMRRRLWWHISLQDARASEDHGADPSFHDHFFDTRMPLNVNDEDIWPEMTEPPFEQPGASDMTFCLIRFELGNIQRKLRIYSSAETDDGRKNTIKEKEQLIEATHAHMQEKYFQHCDPNSPFFWVASTVGKLILAKMWLFVHHPRLYTASSEEEAQDLKHRIFVTSVEVVEFGLMLSQDKATVKWSWLFKTYMQWHAVAYVLSELTHIEPGVEYYRAWNAIEQLYNGDFVQHHPAGQRGALWRPLRQLYARAKVRKEKLANSATPESKPSSNASLDLNSPAHGLMSDFTGNIPFQGGNKISEQAMLGADAWSSPDLYSNNNFPLHAVNSTDVCSLPLSDDKTISDTSMIASPSLFTPDATAQHDQVKPVPSLQQQLSTTSMTNKGSTPTIDEQAEFKWIPDMNDFSNFSYDFQYGLGPQNQQATAWMPPQQEWH